MGKPKKKRLPELAAGQVDDGHAMIEGVKPLSLGERCGVRASDLLINRQLISLISI